MNAVTDAVRNIKLSRNGNNFVPGTNMTCSADGYPLPQFQWLGTNGVKVMDGASFTVSTLSSEAYKCIASNTVGGQPNTIESISIMFNSTVNPDEGLLSGIYLASLLDI